MIQEKDLPESYVDAMKELLEEDYDAYIKSLDEKPYVGIRTNLLKLPRKSLKKFLTEIIKRFRGLKRDFTLKKKREY